MTPGGFPHSGIPGSKAVCASPGLIAACRALRRLPMPRHPPCALGIFSSRPPSRGALDFGLVSGYRPDPSGSGRYVDSYQKKYRSRSMPTTSDRRLRKTLWSFFSYLNLRDCALISKFRLNRYAALKVPPGLPGSRMLGWEVRSRGSSLARPDLGARGFSRGGELRSTRFGPLGLPRKEVIQPHLPVRLPCYDFTPLTLHTFDASAPRGFGRRLRVQTTRVV